MKYLSLILLLIAFVGCNNFNQNKFDAFHDSCNKWQDLYYCYNKCNKRDSAYYAMKQGDKYVDSLNFYYFKLYPEKLKQIQEAQKLKDKNCNCK